MPAISATAPGKCILLGEHAVVYERPAIAVPLFQMQAHAIVLADVRAPAGRIHLQAPDIGLETDLNQMESAHPLALAIQSVLAELKINRPPALTLRISSSVPIAAGLGSGAAVSVAIIRALSTFLGAPLSDERVNQLAFEVEKLHHVTPSGIDNTVITYGLPVYFIKNHVLQPFTVSTPFTLVIGNTGIHSPTAQAVADLRAAWQAAPQPYEARFDQIAWLVDQAYALIQAGRPQEMGPLMNANHTLLQEMGVSCPELDHLVQAARSAGALGAKLSGAGRGGNMLALAQPADAPTVAAALRAAGAIQTWITSVGNPSHSTEEKQ